VEILLQAPLDCLCNVALTLEKSSGSPVNVFPSAQDLAVHEYRDIQTKSFGDDPWRSIHDARNEKQARAMYVFENLLMRHIPLDRQITMEGEVQDLPAPE
jgi:hypothetical protein